MTRINFQEFKIPTGISKTTFRQGDARESVANMLYLNFNGIRAHALAMKIFNSVGESEYSSDEINMIVSVANIHGTPAFIDALHANIDNQSNQE